MDTTSSAELLGRIESFVHEVALSLEPREREMALTYMFGLLSAGDRKNVEGLMRKLSGGAARPARERRMRGMLADGEWSGAALMEASGEELVRRTTGWSAYVLDDTSIVKRGRHSVGVGKQYAGCIGATTNCQTIVTLSIAQDGASALISAELYLPNAWCGSNARSRRRTCKVPEHLSEYQTKGEMALYTVRMRSPELPKLPYLFDAGYGVNTDFRDALTLMGEQYVGGVTLETSVWPEGTEFAAPAPQEPGKGGRPRTRLVAKNDRRKTRIRILMRALPRSAWREVEWREGSRGPQKSRFAALRVRAARGAGEDGRVHPENLREEEWLLIHWPHDKAEPTKAWFSNLPASTSIIDLVRLARLRWRIERDHQECKELIGFDHYEGRSWPGLHHHLALVLMSQHVLTLERLRTDASGSTPERHPALSPPIDKAARHRVCACSHDHDADREPHLRPMSDLQASQRVA